MLVHKNAYVEENENNRRTFRLNFVRAVYVDLTALKLYLGGLQSPFKACIPRALIYCNSIHKEYTALRVSRRSVLS